MCWERSGLALLAELKLPALVTGAAPGPASSPVPWFLPVHLHSPAAKLLPLAWHFFPPPLPWAFTSDGISRNRWRYIGTRHIWFNTSLPCSSVIFDEPKNWAPNDGVTIHCSFFVFLLGKIPQPVLVLACHTICQRILRWEKCANWYIFSVSFTFPSWPSRNHMCQC